MFGFARRIAFYCFLSTLLPAPLLAQDLVQAGVSAAVRGAVDLARAGAVGRRIESGEPIFLSDVIKAGPDSGMQILLLDETVFTIGANSEMTIDTFVYDPDTGVGQVAASISKGVFRFITGKIAQKDPDKMSVQTPLGTIGIRGTIVGGAITDTRAEIVLLGPGLNNNTPDRSGAIIVSNPQGSVEIRRSGFGTVLTPNAPPTPAAPAVVQPLDGPGPDPAANNPGAEENEQAADENAEPTAGGPTAGAEGGAPPPIDGPAATRQSGQGGAVSFTSAGFQGGILAEGSANQPPPDVLMAGTGVGAINTITQLNGGAGVFHFVDTKSLSDGGTYTIGVDLDFDNRSIGGGNSAVTINPTSFSSGSFSILSNAFSTGSGGQAVFDGQSSITFTCGADTCVGAVSMTFRDFGETVAGALEHEVTVNNTTISKTVSGSGTDPERLTGTY